MNKQIISITSANENSINEVYNIEKKLFRNSWTLLQLSDEIKKHDSILKTLTIDRAVIGYYIINISFETCEIYKIAVKKIYQNHGFGQKMMNDIEMTAKKNSALKLYLEVDESNIQAIKFYIKNRFLKIHERNNYYGTGKAFIMEKHL